MSLGQVLILAYKDDGRNPEFLCLVLLQSVANDFRFTNVSTGYAMLPLVAIFELT
jgi:hypothetical protein